MLPAAGIVPVRFASTRFPGKALVEIGGKPMIQHVCERARQSRALTRLLVATDDVRIRQAVEAFGVETRMTSPGHTSGTARAAEAARDLSEPVVVVIQGDEPLIDPRGIDAAVAPLASDPGLAVTTLYESIEEPDEVFDPNVVKVVLDAQDEALYFSRAPIPYLRGEGELLPDFRRVLAQRRGGPPRYLKHVGLYAFRRERLLQLATLPQSEAEAAEGLEQLRWLHAGARVRALLAPGRSVGVDTPRDLDRVRRMMAAATGKG